LLGKGEEAGDELKKRIQIN
jgi:hypothetical protein